MATKKKQVNEKLIEAVNSTPPTSPALSRSDKTYLKGLTRRGYKHEEIIAIGRKAGFDVKTEDLVTKTRKKKVAPVAPSAPAQH